MESSKSFMGYKKDQRGILEVSPMANEKYVEEQREKYEDMKSKLKYRLYGVDGVTDYEIRKLVKLGEIEKKQPNYPLPEENNAMKAAVHLYDKENKGFKIKPLCPEIFERK